MAEIASTTFSQVDASNTGPLPGLTGATNPNQIDNSIQAMMGAVKREHDWRNYAVTSGGSSNAYTLTYAVAPAAYYTPMRFTFKTSFAVTGAATVNVNTLGAKTIKKLVSGTKTDLASGDIASGDYIDLVYDGTDMVWVNKGVASAPSGALTSSGYTMATARIIGRTTASTGAPEEISIGSGLSLSGGSLSASGGTAVTVIRSQVFTSSGTYTPHASMLYCRVIATGSGGGGGGADSFGSGVNLGVGGGGGAGATAIEVYSAATIGASQSVTIGSAGSAGSATNGTNGGNGGDTTLGALLTGGGGSGGTGGNTAAQLAVAGGAGGTASGGDINITGGDGAYGMGSDVGSFSFAVAGIGGASYWGGGGRGGAFSDTTGTSAAIAGRAGGAYGSGGGGGATVSIGGAAGGAGAAGVVYIEEYCSA